MTTPPDGPPDGTPLDVHPLEDGLRRRSVSGALVTLAAQWTRFLLHLGSLALLARMLPPDDFGLLGMVVAVTGLLVAFKDLGLSEATVQRDRLTREQVSGLFWINVLLSVAVALATLALAPALATFYGEPRLAGIAMALSPAFLLSGLGVQHRALLIRQLRFGALAWVEIASQLLSVVAAVLAAWAGAGVWALVLQQVTLPAAATAGCWLACDWRPGRLRRRSGLRAPVRFGGYLTGFGITNYLARNLDDVLVGRYAGSAALGFYTKAYGLVMLPLRQVNEPLSRIAIPALSRLQTQPERFRRYYLQGLSFVALGCMPGIACLYALSREVIEIVLGPRWGPAAELFSILALVALVQPALNTLGWVYVSLGQTERMFRWGVLSSAVTCAAFVIGLPGGARGVATAYAVAVYALAAPGAWYALRRAPVRLREAAAVLLRPAVLAAVMGLSARAVRDAVAPGPAWQAAGLALAAAVAAGGVLVALWPSLRSEVSRLRSLLAELRRGGGAPGAADPETPSARTTA